MSIASELSALNGYILGAYDEVSGKGGTVPANKNMANLASAIASISAGTPTTITPLEVTENGTYTAPTGTAYSPVTVNVSGGGGAVLCNMGTFTPSSSGVYNLEHGLDKKPIIWGIRPKASLQNMQFEKHEAIQKLNYYTGSVVNQNVIYAYQAVTVGTGAHFGARLYNQNLDASSTWVDATTEWTSSGAVSMPVNDKYIGVNVYEAGSTTTNHLKVGVEYLWFAMANDS